MKKIIVLVAILCSIATTYSQTTYTMGTDTGSFSTCSGTFVDSGGGGNYSNNETGGAITFCPTTPGDFIQVSFSAFNTESTTFDFLSLWNANSNAGVADSVFGGNLGAFTIVSTSPDGCVTFEFDSDSSLTYAGWSATIACVSPCTTPIADLANTTTLNICGPKPGDPHCSMNR